MSLYKRGNTWWVDITPPSGPRVRESAGTSNRKAAQEYHDRLKAQAWREEKLSERHTATWDEAAKRFLDEAEGKASLKEYERQVAFWTEHFRGRSLDAITRQRVAELVEAKAHTPATRNRYVACIRAILKKSAGAWEWLDRAPKLKTYTEPKQRIRWITEKEAQGLLAALPEWLAEMARFSLATGLRQSNVLRMEWTQVDVVRRVAWVHPDQAKARKAIGVPLNEDAVAVVLRQRGKHLRRVFVGHDGEPMDSWKTTAQVAWKSACKEAGIKDFRWHDLRHTWASWHVQRGTPLYALKELGGWETLEIVKRYAHLAPEHLKAYAERVSLASAEVTSQLRHSGKSLENVGAA
jgi:integrase